MTTKEEFITLLSQCQTVSLQETLTGNGIYYPPEASSPDLARSIADSIWKYSHTPLGKTFLPSSLEDIIQIYCKKLSYTIDAHAPLTHQLQALRQEILSTNPDINIADIPPELQERLERSVLPTILGAGAAGGAAGARWAAGKVLEWTALKWLDLIKLIPQVGPAIITIRNTAGLVSRISGPLGIALAIWSVNNGFGPKWDRCLGLLLGAALCLETQPIDISITDTEKT